METLDLQSTDADARFMAAALALGRRGLGNTWPNPAVGAVVVRDGVIVGRGHTQPGGRPHAETEALSKAGELARGATLYVTLEPCTYRSPGRRTPPCLDATLAAGVARVVSAIEDPNPLIAGRAHARLREAGVAVTVGVGAEEARRDHAGHLSRVTRGRPHVLLKLAVSSDGKGGLAGRRPVRITGEAARERVHLMRAQADAILVGIGTVLADDPELTCRLPGLEGRSPVRLVLDATLRTPLAAKLVTGAQSVPTWIFAAVDAPVEPELALREAGVEVMRVGRGADGGLDLPEVLGLLATRGITRLMVEGGPKVAAAFVAADLVDEAALFRAPEPLGSDAIDALEGLPLDALAPAPRFTVIDDRLVGPDRLIHSFRS